ncbi:MAG: nitroreductase family protein [Clostridia bacterium]|nr:nitroreductase family protein [Clostridia bacterium]
MNYSALIQNRKSVREFANKKVPASVLEELEGYHRQQCKRLLPGLKTELRIFGADAGAALEEAAGYNQFVIGAPQYLVLLSEKHEHAEENAGYVMEDLVLKLTDMDLGTCWLTFTDSARVKQALQIDSGLDVAAIIGFGYGVKAKKRILLNILSMSNVDASAKRHYFDPKRSVNDMVYINAWGNQTGLDEQIGFYEDVLWESLYAASLSPSYLNRQAYGFVIRDGNIILVSRPDAYNTQIDGDLSLGIALLHFTGVASNWTGRVEWQLGQNAAAVQLPEGYRVIASCCL